MAPLIQARILKGFRDLLPNVALPRQQMLDQIRQVFSLFGYVPIETPALEYAEILLGKGSEETDKQLYRFIDQGDRDVALRFDLTVPLARFTAMHINTLGTPFRRYHIAPVWRAEKPQRGRFREFTQCDFDIIGCSSATSDAEIVHLIHSIFKRLTIPVTIRINHRGLLSGILSVCGAEGKEVPVLRAIDKLEKLGAEVVKAELQSEAGLGNSQIDQLFELLSLSKTVSSASEILNHLRQPLSSSERGAHGVAVLQEVFAAISEVMPPESAVLDLSIARGLDYYTGVVFETQCRALPDIGSICSGGRYDNLTGVYSKQVHPGVGASVGLDRTLAALEELGMLSAKSSCAQVLITRLDDGKDGALMKLAELLRDSGISAEVYPERAKLGAQLKYADRKGIEFAVVAGSNELASNSFGVKELKKGTQIDGIPRERMVEKLQELLRASAES